MAPALSIVIPAYREERRIAPSLRRVLDWVERTGKQAEVLVVDDASEDRTAAIAESALRGAVDQVIRLGPRNHGKGWAVREGMLAARGDLVLFSDADLSAPIEQADHLISAITDGGADVAIGSRWISGAVIAQHQPWVRERLGRVFNGAVQILALPGLNDTQCGFKCFRREVAREVFSLLTIPGFGFDVEALLVASKLGYRVVEVPITWSDAANSRVRALTDGSRMVADVLRARLVHRGLSRRTP